MRPLTSVSSAGQAAVWLARGGALVTLLHRRADLRETMSDYLVRELERYGVAVRDYSEISALHGADGQLEAVRRRSFGIAYRMLGSVSDAEDVAQEALLRFTSAEEQIHEPAAWITTVATRLSIDVFWTYSAHS